MRNSTLKSTLVICGLFLLVFILVTTTYAAQTNPAQAMTQTPTPTVVVDPSSIVDETLDGAKIEKKDIAEFIKKWNMWQPKPLPVMEDGMLKLIGDNKNGGYQGFSHPDQFREGKGLMFLFKWTGSEEITIGFDRGDWDTDTYKSYDVDPGVGAGPAYVFGGKKIVYQQQMKGNLSLKKNTIYYLLMVLDKDGVFLTKIWDPKDPKKVLSNRYDKAQKDWGGLDWTFRFRIEGKTTAIFLNDYADITFSNIKAGNTPNGTQIRVQTETPDANLQVLPHFTLKEPKDGTSFGTKDKMAFSWDAFKSSVSYRLEIFPPNAKKLTYTTNGPSIVRYSESLPWGGQFTWQVIALNRENKPIAFSGQSFFSKPILDGNWWVAPVGYYYPPQLGCVYNSSGGCEKICNGYLRGQKCEPE